MKKIIFAGLVIGMFMALGAMEKDDDDFQPIIKPVFLIEDFAEDRAILTNYLQCLEQISTYRIQSRDFFDLAIGLAVSLGTPAEKIEAQSHSQEKQITLLMRLDEIHAQIRREIGENLFNHEIRNIERSKRLVQEAKEVESELLAEYQEYPELLQHIITNAPGSSSKREEGRDNSFEKLIQNKQALQSRLLDVARNEQGQYKLPNPKDKQSASTVTQTTSSWKGKQKSYADDDWHHTTASYNAPAYNENFRQMRSKQLELGVSATRLQDEHQTNIAILQAIVQDNQEKCLDLVQNNFGQMGEYEREAFGRQQEMQVRQRAFYDLGEQLFAQHKQTSRMLGNNATDTSCEYYQKLFNEFGRQSEYMRSDLQRAKQYVEKELDNLWTNEQLIEINGPILQQELTDLENQEQKTEAFDNHVQAIHGLRIRVLHEQEEGRKTREVNQRWHDKAKPQQSISFPEIPEKLTGYSEDQYAQCIQVMGNFLDWSQRTYEMQKNMMKIIVSGPVDLNLVPPKLRENPSLFREIQLENSAYMSKLLAQKKLRNKRLEELLKITEGNGKEEGYSTCMAKLKKCNQAYCQTLEEFEKLTSSLESKYEDESNRGASSELRLFREKMESLGKFISTSDELLKLSFANTTQSATSDEQLSLVTSTESKISDID